MYIEWEYNCTCVPENPLVTAVGCGFFSGPDMRAPGKIQVLLVWMGQEQSVVPVGVVTTMDLSLAVCTV